MFDEHSLAATGRKFQYPFREKKTKKQRLGKVGQLIQDHTLAGFRSMIYTQIPQPILSDTMIGHFLPSILLYSLSTPC